MNDAVHCVLTIGLDHESLSASRVCAPYHLIKEHNLPPHTFRGRPSPLPLDFSLAIRPST